MNRLSTFALTVTVPGMCLLLGAEARAQFVPVAWYSVGAQCHRVDPDAHCFTGGLTVPTTCSCDRQEALVFNGVPVTYQSVASGTTSGGVAPMADAQAAVTNGGFSDIRSTLSYTVGVFPRTPGAAGRTVPLLVDVRGSVNATSSNRIGDYVTATAVSELCIANDVCVRGTARVRCLGEDGCEDAQNFNFSGVLNVPVEEEGGFASGNVYVILSLQAQPTTNQDVFGSVGAQGVADPVVVIDPAYEFRDEYILMQSRNLFCASDFNFDSVVDFFDYLDFVAAFADNLPAADFNLDEEIDFFDYLDFVAAFSTGC